MKSLWENVTKNEIRSFLVGLVLGFFLSLTFFVAAVPSGMDMIALYYPERIAQTETADTFSVDVGATSTKR